MGGTNVKLHTSIEAPDPVYGLAVMDKKFYVLRKRQSDQIYVYDTKDYRLQHTVSVAGLNPHCYNDMTECKAEKCLFLSDFDAKCIRKVTVDKGEASKFVDVPYEPKGLSITPEGNLLVTCNPNRLVEFCAKTGNKLCEVELRLDVNWPKHAVKRKDGQYVVCHAQKGLSRVCRVGADGYFRHSFGGTEGDGKEQLNCPCHLALRDDNHVIVVDNDNNRLVLLDPTMEYVDTLVEKFVEPHRVWYDSDSKRLYVGECTDNGSISVFQIK